MVPALDPSGGGMFQYSQAMAVAMEGLVHMGTVEGVVAFVPSTGDASVLPDTFERHPIEPPSASGGAKKVLRRVLPEGRLLDEARRWRARLSGRVAGGGTSTVARRPSVGDWMKRHEVDLVVFPAPDALAFESGMPSLMTIHDLQHRLQPEFPEVSERSQWKMREYIYRNAAREALTLLVDSEIGKEDVLELYGVHGATPERVKVLPFVPSTGLRTDLAAEKVEGIRKGLGLPEDFLLYPAQFWPHKNHLRLVEALGSLRHLDVAIALCGSNSGSLRQTTFREVMRRASELRVADRVHYLGYVSDDELSALYALARALVFPTFFGPTNIPIVEAWNFDVPVLTSRIRGVTEQVGDAALLVDPRSVPEIAAGIERLWTDERLRTSLARAGRRKLSLYTPEDHGRRLGEILLDARERLGSGTS